MYCDKCGNKIREGDSFCTSCGNSVGINNNETGSNASVVFVIIAMFTICIPFICIPCAIIAIIMSRKNNKNTFSLVMGIVTLILSILFSIVVALFVMFAAWEISSDKGNIINKAEKYVEEHGNDIDDFGKYFDKYFDEEEDDDDDFELSNHSYKASDGSVLVLDDNDNYTLYGEKNSNNYSSGTYEVYNGLGAVNYIVAHLSEFGLSYDKQMKFFDNDKYDLDDYYLLILNCEKVYVDGKESSEKEDSRIYYGFYDDGTLKFIDIKTGKNNNFVLDDDKKSNDGTL